ncbi:MAG: GNAT family N-acetyltransferase [Candidatus Omnitrophota bacterium]|jgi:CelD/BcsL family acetyltransferase involved in cellulose biosynthesis
MDLQFITTHSGFLGLEKAWNALLEESGNESVFLTFEWFKTWWDAFGKNKHLFILLIKDTAGKIIGIAPLMKYIGTCAGLPVRKISFLYNDNAAECGFILSENRDQSLNKIAAHLEKQENNWDIIEFQSIVEDSENYKELKKILRKNSARFGVKNWLHSPYISIDSEWKEFASSRPKKLRKNLRNLLNKLNREGTFSIQQVNRINQSGTILSTIIAISETSWKIRYNQSIARTPENKRFFEDLYAIACKKNWLNIWLLKIQQEPVAYEYHLVYKNKAYALRADFNEAYKHASPGAVLNTQIIKSYFENGLKEYDLCGHADDYKLCWTSALRKHSIFVIYRKNWYGTLLYFLDYVCLYRMREFLKKFKILRRIKKILF